VALFVRYVGVGWPVRFDDCDNGGEWVFGASLRHESP